MRCVSGANWGASKGILLTIYKALILSRLDYCSFVYHGCSKTLSKKLDSVQYKALLIAVGGLKGTALKALLGECGEIPLELRREKLLLKYLIKIKNVQDNAVKYILSDEKFFHLELKCKSIYKIMLDRFLSANNILLNPYDKIFPSTPWFNFHNIVDLHLFEQLKVVHSAATVTELNSKTIETYIGFLSSSFINLIYVDGSVRKDGKVGAAIFSKSPPFKQNFTLPSGLSIYYAESFAILQALLYSLENKIPSLCILSDSKSVLYDIREFNIGKSPHPCLINEICKLISDNHFQKISLAWLPGHSNNTYINTVDLLAKSAASLINPQTISYTSPEAILVVDEWIKRRWHEDWKKTPTCEYQKSFGLRGKVPSFSSNRIKDCIFSRLRLCQTKLNHGLFKIGVIDNDLCDVCCVKEDGAHLLFECLKTESLRDELNKLTVLDKQILVKHDLERLLSSIPAANIIIRYLIKNNISV